MTAAEYICECTHPKSQHKRERDGCRSPECAGACAKFECDLKASEAAQGVEQARVLTVVAEVCEDQAEKARAELGEEPRSGHPVLRTLRARVAAVEQERDEARDCWSAAERDLTVVRNERDQANELTDKIAAEMHLVTRERDSLARRLAVRFQEKQALEAELTSARTELEARRNLGVELEKVRARSLHFETRANDQLAATVKAQRELVDARAAAEEKVRAVLDADRAPTARQVHTYDALYCTTCYGRFLPDTDAADNHVHPLIPVVVSITHRTEGESDA